jgi:hypothetical protein
LLGILCVNRSDKTDNGKNQEKSNSFFHGR